MCTFTPLCMVVRDISARIERNRLPLLLRSTYMYVHTSTSFRFPTFGAHHVLVLQMHHVLTLVFD